MRFFISSNIKSNAPLYTTVILFLFFGLAFWISGWFYFHFKFGLTYEKMFAYFFTDPEYPEPMSLTQLLEDIHVQTFLYSLFLLALSSIFIHKCIRDRIKYLLILSSFGFGFTEILSGLLIYFVSPLFIYLKILSFILFQLSTGFMLAFALKLYLTKEKEEPPERGILFTLVFLFSGTVLLFATFSFFLFTVKLGYTPERIAGYYLGNPELFIRKKTLHGLIEVFTLHLASMAVYIFTVAHFAFFTNLKRKVQWSAFLFACAFIDNLSGFLILRAGYYAVYVKMLSFLGLTAGLYYLSAVAMISILKHRARPIVVL